MTDETRGLNTLARVFTKAMEEKGFWDLRKRAFAHIEKLATEDSELASFLKGCVTDNMDLLIISEVIEGMEARRKGRICTLSEEGLNKLRNMEGEQLSTFYKERAKDTEQFEMAGLLYRILDKAGGLGWDIDSMLEIEHKFNLTRPRKHGKKF